MHAGFDSPYYHGLDAFRWLKKNTNMEWFGYYIAPWGAVAPYQSQWYSAIPRLRDEGWGLVPIYLGKQPDKLAATLKARGMTGKERFDGYGDGVEATKFASATGFGPATVIYFDMEKYEYTKAWHQYLHGWMEGVMDAGYYPGLYCSHLRADELESSADITGYPFMPHPRIWAVAPSGKFGETLRNAKGGPVTDYKIKFDKLNSVSTSATSWQYRHNVFILWVDESHKKPKTMSWKVDVNCSVYANPAKWG